MIWILLVIMQFKHFIADYPLQNAYMLGKFKDKGWIIPLAAHCGVHFLFTFLITLSCLFFTNGGFIYALMFGFLDFCVHFVMDRIKADPKLLGKFQALSKLEFMSLKTHPNFTQQDADKAIKSNTYFWYSLGLDQMVHHLTDLLIVYLIISKLGL